LRLGTLFGRDRGRKFKARVAAAAAKIEEHRKELELIRGKLDARRRALYASVLSAVRERDEARASIFGGEHAELRKVGQVVALCELALTQVIIRLQSIQDVTDVVRHVNSAFQLMQGVTGSARGTLPALQSATQQVEAALSVTMQDLGQLSPGVSVDLGAQESEEIVQRAKMYAEEKAQELAGPLPGALWTGSGESLVDKAEDLAPLLSQSHGGAGRNSPAELHSGSSPEEEVYNYAMQHAEEIDVIDASASLRLPVEVVEDSLLKLVTAGRLRAPKAREPVA
jgi:division protein CdvB (Snf7/Vps24/ESCRT-III family)